MWVNEALEFKPRETVTSWHSQSVFNSASLVLDWRKGRLGRFTARLLERLFGESGIIARGRACLWLVGA
jgi:hypothetical protein